MLAVADVHFVSSARFTQLVKFLFAVVKITVRLWTPECVVRSLLLEGGIHPNPGPAMWNIPESRAVPFSETEQQKVLLQGAVGDSATIVWRPSEATEGTKAVWRGRITSKRHNTVCVLWNTCWTKEEQWRAIAETESIIPNFAVLVFGVEVTKPTVQEKRQQSTATSEISSSPPKKVLREERPPEEIESHEEEEDEDTVETPAACQDVIHHSSPEEVASLFLKPIKTHWCLRNEERLFL